MSVRKRRPRGRRPRGKWSPEIRDRFLALLRESGNARATLKIVGHPNMFYKRRRSDPEFRRAWDETVAAVDARLKSAASPFPELAAPKIVLATDAVALGGYLRPRRKRPQARPQPVIRRTSNGRVQLTLARDGQMTAQDEADFVALLRATGNFNASARAIGFQPASLYERYRKWPAFARACDEALKDASVQLDFQLVAHAHALLGTEPADKTCRPDVPFDPEAAIRILAFLDRRRDGRTGRGRRKGAPQRSFEEACESILRKIEAIERHEQWQREQGECPSPPLDGKG